MKNGNIFGRIHQFLWRRAVEIMYVKLSVTVNANNGAIFTTVSLSVKISSGLVPLPRQSIMGDLSMHLMTVICNLKFEHTGLSCQMQSMPILICLYYCAVIFQKFYRNASCCLGILPKPPKHGCNTPLMLDNL